jgi:AmmeMemoRadiSam system protein A
MSSTNPAPEFTPIERATLLEIAFDSIVTGLGTGQPLKITSEALPDKLSDIRACFVTLEQDGRLRGCIGSLEPHTTLANDASHNAYASAFRDPRFKPLQAVELDTLTIQMSILGKATAIDFASEQDLIKQLRPGIDGLILQDIRFRGTFLPSVWKSLPAPDQFLAHLKLKAGLPGDHWSESVRVWRYTTESFSASVPEIRVAETGYPGEVLK